MRSDRSDIGDVPGTVAQLPDGLDQTPDDEPGDDDDHRQGTVRDDGQPGVRVARDCHRNAGDPVLRGPGGDRAELDRCAGRDRAEGPDEVLDLRELGLALLGLRTRARDGAQQDG
jgi:hypothetical protein